MTAEFPWNSVSVASGYRRNPRVSTASATAHGTSTVNATVVATARHVPLFCPWQLRRTNHDFLRNCRGNFDGHPRPLPRQRGNHHGSPRKFAAIAMAVSMDVQPQQLPRPSTAVRGHCHGNHPMRGKYHGIPQKSAAIATAVSPNVQPQQFPWPSAAVRGHCHGNCHVNRRKFPLRSRWLQR